MIPREAYQDVTGFEAKKVRLTQDPKDGYYNLTLKIDPKDAPRWLLDAPAGTFLACGVKALDYDNPEPEPGPNPIVQRAAMICKNKHFQEWLAKEHNVEYLDHRPPDFWAAEFVCYYCDISSRAELRNNEVARKKFEKLIQEFEATAKKLSFT